MRYAGIDIDKRHAHVTIRVHSGEIHKRLTITNDASGFDKLEEYLEADDRLGLEACTQAYALHDHFTEKGYDVWMGEPRRLRSVWDTDHKNDVQDADELSDLLRINRFPRSYVPPPEILRLRNLLRIQIDLGKSTTRVKNKIHALLERNGIKPPFNGKRLFEEKGIAWLKEPHFNDEKDAVILSFAMELESLAQRRDVIDKQMAKIAVKSESAKHLMTVTGIDYYVALMIIAEVGNIRRFQNYSHFRSYAGCAPRWGQSGPKRWSNGTNRMCNERLKWALSIATRGAVRGDNKVAQYYQKQLKKTGAEGKSLSRARVKMCDTVYSLLRKEESCEWGNPTTIRIKQRKMERRAVEAVA